MLRRVDLRKRRRAAARRPVAVAGHPRAVERTQLVPNRVVRLHVASTTSAASTHNTFRSGARIAAGCGRIGINRTAKEIGMTVAATPTHGRIREVVVYFLRLGLLGFGGPVALVGQMERELVAERKWLTKEQMREAIAICQSLPGPLAIQVGIYVSYLRTGFWRMGRRLGLYLPEFRDRRGARRPLRPSRRSAASERHI